MKLDIRTDEDGNKWFYPKTWTQDGIMRDCHSEPQFVNDTDDPTAYSQKPRYPLSELIRVVAEVLIQPVLIYQRLLTMTDYDIDDYRDAVREMNL